MALDETLVSAAQEFGRALAHAPAVVAYRTTTAALEADAGAQALLADLRSQQMTLVRMQQTGISPSASQLEAFRLCQANVRGSETIMAQLRATNDVKAFLPVAARHITGVLGFDYAQIVAPQTC